MKTTKNITIDINRADVINVYEVHQGEACSREFALTLTDGSSIVDLSNNVTAKANATVNHVIVAIDEPLTIVNNKIILLLTENMQSLSGVLKVDVTVLEGDEILTAATLRFRVSPAAIDGNSRFEPLYPTLQEMINAGIKPEAITAAVNAYLDEHGAENLVYEALVYALSNDPTILSPKLTVDNTIDATYNPNGHYILYYIDSDDGRHNIFDFSQYFAEKAAVPTKTSQLTNDSGFITAAAIANKVDKESGKGLSTNDFTDTDKNLLKAACVETKNCFNIETGIILGKNGTGDSSAIRAVTVALNTGGGKSVVSVKNLPSNLKYQVWGYNDGNFTSPTNYTTTWIEKRGQSTVVAKPYVRVLFGTVNNATITMVDFEGLELQVEEGEQKTDYAPKYTAFDYVARNRSYPVHLKVCSYNVGMYSNGIPTDTPATNALENMSGFLGANNFDILGIQEGRINVNGTNADETVYNDYFISQKSLVNNCALKSQFVLKDTGEGTFTAGSRKYVYATAIIGNKEVFIINVHLALTATDRASNYTELLALLKAHEYFIAFGDFNAAIDYNTGVEEQTQAEYNNLINAGYTVANGGRWGLLTTVGTQTKYPDNICVSGNIKIITSKTADVYATMNSDHIPIIAELVV